MKSIQLLPRFLLLSFAFAIASATVVLAEDTTAPATPTATAPAPAAKSKLLPGGLTKSEMGQIGKAHNGVLASNPELKGEDDTLKIQAKDLKAKGAAATPEEKAALKTQQQEHEQKMRAAELAFDPTLAPIFAKLDAMPKKNKK